MKFNGSICSPVCLNESVIRLIFMGLCGLELCTCLQNRLFRFTRNPIEGNEQWSIPMSVSLMLDNDFCSKFEEITNHRRFQTGDWELHVTECFQDLYKSIFGSISDMQLCQVCLT